MCKMIQNFIESLYLLMIFILIIFIFNVKNQNTINSSSNLDKQETTNIEYQSETNYKKE